LNQINDIFATSGEDEERFLRFVNPMAETFQSLEQIVASGTAR